MLNGENVPVGTTPGPATCLCCGLIGNAAEAVKGPVDTTLSVITPKSPYRAGIGDLETASAPFGPIRSNHSASTSTVVRPVAET